MSENTVTTTTTTDAPTTITPKQRKRAESVPFSSLHVRYAKVKGVDTTRAAKLNRSYIRSNFDAIAKQWPALRASQKANRDSNRYPDMIPSALADAIVKRTVAPLKK